jgi:hypothetical protein
VKGEDNLITVWVAVLAGALMGAFGGGRNDW